MQGGTKEVGLLKCMAIIWHFHFDGTKLQRDYRDRGKSKETGFFRRKYFTLEPIVTCPLEVVDSAICLHLVKLISRIIHYFLYFFRWHQGAVQLAMWKGWGYAMSGENWGTSFQKASYCSLFLYVLFSLSLFPSLCHTHVPSDTTLVHQNHILCLKR